MTGDPSSLPADKRERIIRAALAEFAARGYENASTNVITRQAGISKGLLFHYWGSKSGLYLYLAEYCVDYYAAWAARNFGGEQPNPDMIERIIEGGLRRLRFVQEEPDISRFITVAFSEPPPAVAPQIAALAKRYVPTVNEELSHGVDLSLLRPGVDIKRVLMGINIFALGLRAVYAKTLGDDLSSAEALIEETKGYLDLLKYGVYRQPPE